MPKLLLVKHSTSNHNPDQPPQDWGLTSEGIQRAKVLATYIKPYAPQKLYTSTMPKARDTAQLVSAELHNIPVIENPLLEEHSRKSNAPYGSVEAFNTAIKRMFTHPNNLIFGDETAKQAQDRFTQGITQIIENTPDDDNVVVIAHGTVNTLFTAQYNPITPYDLWSRLKLPSIIILNLPTFTVDTVIDDAGIA